jgi:hypothetical protein
MFAFGHRDCSSGHISSTGDRRAARRPSQGQRLTGPFPALACQSSSPCHRALSTKSMACKSALAPLHWHGCPFPPGTSCRAALANQVRLVLHTAAYPACPHRARRYPDAARSGIGRVHHYQAQASQNRRPCHRDGRPRPSHLRDSLFRSRSVSWLRQRTDPARAMIPGAPAPVIPPTSSYAFSKSDPISGKKGRRTGAPHFAARKCSSRTLS